jgi:hypothetical protein
VSTFLHVGNNLSQYFTHFSLGRGKTSDAGLFLFKPGLVSECITGATRNILACVLHKY